MQAIIHGPHRYGVLSLDRDLHIGYGEMLANTGSTRIYLSSVGQRFFLNPGDTITNDVKPQHVAWTRSIKGVFA